MAEEFRDMNISDPDDATTGAAVGPSTQPGPISIVESIGTNQKVRFGPCGTIYCINVDTFGWI